MKKLLSLALLCTLAGFSSMAQNEDCSIKMLSKGNIQINNSLLDMEMSPLGGRRHGIFKWTFRPTGLDMIDRIYNNDLYRSSIFGVEWDAAPSIKAKGGRLLPRDNKYIPLAFGKSDNGASCSIVQEYKRDVIQKRTVIVRSDYSVLEVKWEFENISAPCTGSTMRLVNRWFPGTLSGSYNKNTSLFLPLAGKVACIDQNWKNAEYKKHYKTSKFFTKNIVSGKIKHPWFNAAEAAGFTLSAPWTCEFNRVNGNGMVLIGDDNLAGFYNSPTVTVEMLFKSIALDKGEKWITTTYAGAFSAPADSRITDVNLLFVTCNGKGIVPLFKGRININGKDFPASPDSLIKFSPAAIKTLVAYDTKGREIGSCTDGKVKLTDAGIKYPEKKKPFFWGSVYTPDADSVEKFLKSGDFTVYCGFRNKESVREKAEKLALKLGAGFSSLNPGGKLLIIGSAENDDFTRDAGVVTDGATSTWPDKGEGVIKYCPDLLLTQSPALLVCGRDTAGTLKSIEKFTTKFAKDIPPAKGFSLKVVGQDLKAYPYSRVKGGKDNIALQAARGEYESEQLLLVPYERITDIKISVSDLINSRTGKKLSSDYVTRYRKEKGPVMVRFVDYVPYDAGEEFIYPDPLMERPVSSCDAGKAMGIWLTFIIPEKADPGTYRAELTCSTSLGTQIIPIEMTVWDFKLPRDGMQGEAYASIKDLQKNSKMVTDQEIITWTRNMVEHGMRFIHLKDVNLFRWHFSKEGRFKNFSAPGFEASEDGKILLDTSRFDHIRKLCDQTAKPFKMTYMFTLGSVIFYYRWKEFEFKKTFPKRFEHLPKRSGNKSLNSYYAQEMIVLVRRHLKKMNYLQDTYMKIADEPYSIKWWYETLCQAAVKAKMPYFTSMNNIDYKTTRVDMSDIWQPLYMVYNKDFMEKAKKAGKLLSWYNCGPHPQTLIWTPATEIRSYLWQAAKAELDSVAWWGIQCWSYYGNDEIIWRKNPHSDSMIYPEHPLKKPYFDRKKFTWRDKTMIDGIRWELIREGMEDTKYITVLRRLIEKAKKEGKVKDARKAQDVLDSIWRKTYPTMRHYAPPYNEILEARKAIAKEIIYLKNKLK